jgi:hypothetical protein
MALKLHPSLTQERVQQAAEQGLLDLDNPGFCIDCGADAEGCEPDAERYKCEACGQRSVYGAEQLLLLAF